MASQVAIRVPWLMVAAGILIAEGAVGLLVGYSNDAPLVLLAVPVGAILTGLGVVRRADQARAIAAMLSGLLVVIDLTALPAALNEGSARMVSTVFAELVANGIVLYVVARRWPAEAARGR